MEYLERYYTRLEAYRRRGSRRGKQSPERADVSPVLRHYRLAFTAKEKLDKSKPSRPTRLRRGCEREHGYRCLPQLGVLSLREIAGPAERSPWTRCTAPSAHLSRYQQIYDAMILDYERAGKCSPSPWTGPTKRRLRSAERRTGYRRRSGCCVSWGVPWRPRHWRSIVP